MNSRKGNKRARKNTYRKAKAIGVASKRLIKHNHPGQNATTFPYFFLPRKPSVTKNKIQKAVPSLK